MNNPEEDVIIFDPDLVQEVGEEEIEKYLGIPDSMSSEKERKE